ncbi:MAG: tRNA 2-thiouridine(34) synthase MnmA [Rhodospirillaceae bacterium]|nr:tRNA 2-thiouridine(34) synthase MnmA [Rhodospirillaceae bacterium]
MNDHKPNSMGFAKPPAATRVVVAMSGGVDSSVVAALLKSQGYDTVGLTMQLYDHGAATARSKTCCAGQDIYDARRVSDMIGIPHYVVDYEAAFKTAVMDPFADGYIHGETPVPCVLCNQTVKFRDLLKAAKDLGADALATGHYVQRLETADGVTLHQAADLDRDQSYFLFSTTRVQLDFLRFPLGGMNKRETRDLGTKFGLHVAAKPDSQDICFVPDGDYARVIRALRPEAARPGEIVHVDGRIIGRHQGVIHFTVGQRKGLGVGGEAEPLYVVRIDPEAARIVAGPKEALLRRAFTLRGVNWLGAGQGPAGDGAGARVKLRNTHQPVTATVFGEAGGERARVVLAEPEAAVTPGQVCVVYDGARVLGGGWITRDEASAALPHNLRRRSAAAAPAAAAPVR